MLLSYIDDFLGNIKWEFNVFRILGIPFFKIPYVTYDGNLTYTYELYEILIEKWIEREASRAKDSQSFKTELYRFSSEIAVDIYNQRFKRGGLFINFESIGSFATLRNINLEQLEMTSRSLLNRNNEDQYKFSHRSILEYFLAKKAVTDINFLKAFNFTGMENVKLFFREIGAAKHIRPFFEKDGFALEYCTTSGLIGRAYYNYLSLQFIENLIMIKFNSSFLLEPDIQNFIVTFSSLDIFTGLTHKMEDLEAYKNVRVNKSDDVEKYKKDFQEFIDFQYELKKIVAESSHD